MEKISKKIFILFLTLIAASLAACSTVNEQSEKYDAKSVKEEKKDTSVNLVKPTAPKTAPETKPENSKPEPQVQAVSQVEQSKPVDWNSPSGGTYPTLNPNESVWIHVSIPNQRVYIMNGNNILYTMVCSSGLDTNSDTTTPEGTFDIQPERGLSFYNRSEGEGAKYWVSWKNHGEFLFHSVATDANGNVIPGEAAKLGKKASHGCIRLTVSDAKWIYDHIKTGTKVVIGN